MPLQYLMCQLLHVQTWDIYLSICISYEPAAINNVTGNTDIHTFHITCICFWTNMTVMLHLYVPLQFYCSLHIDPIWLQACIKINKLQHLFTIWLQNKVPATNMPLNATNMPHVQIIWCSHIGGVCHHMCATYEVALVNNVPRITVHRWQCRMTTMLQPDYIYSVGHLAKSIKHQAHQWMVQWHSLLIAHQNLFG